MKGCRKEQKELEEGERGYHGHKTDQSATEEEKEKTQFQKLV
jgi:hypothetical protein